MLSAVSTGSFIGAKSKFTAISNTFIASVTKRLRRYGTCPTGTSWSDTSSRQKVPLETLRLGSGKESGLLFHWAGDGARRPSRRAISTNIGSPQFVGNPTGRRQIRESATLRPCDVIGGARAARNWLTSRLSQFPEAVPAAMIAQDQSQPKPKTKAPQQSTPSPSTTTPQARFRGRRHHR